MGCKNSLYPTFELFNIHGYPNKLPSKRWITNSPKFYGSNSLALQHISSLMDYATIVTSFRWQKNGQLVTSSLQRSIVLCFVKEKRIQNSPSWPIHTPLWIMQKSPIEQFCSETLYLHSHALLYQYFSMYKFAYKHKKAIIYVDTNSIQTTTFYDRRIDPIYI